MILFVYATAGPVPWGGDTVGSHRSYGLTSWRSNNVVPRMMNVWLWNVIRADKFPCWQLGIDILWGSHTHWGSRMHNSAKSFSYSSKKNIYKAKGVSWGFVPTIQNTSANSDTLQKRFKREKQKFCTSLLTN